ncbi:MAG: N-acetylmuramic acid 6-phosphate etherase [Candidatus Gastranaerophilales bacterium]|nr:N-acetylmuramic acid 6-phosphate etherase [Candidatus Gastranaerophilales bacterium]
MSDNKVILTERKNHDTVNIDLASSLEIAQMISNEDKKAVEAVEAQKEKIAEAIDLITEKILKGGNLLYFGAGTSGRLGVLDASECPPTFGVEPELVYGYIAGGDKALRTAIEGAEDDFEQGGIDFLNSNFNENSVVAGISAGGNAPWVCGVLSKARENNISTVAITCNSEAKIKNLCDIFICLLTGEEAITGSTRMKAGTAQKLVLNMLSTGVMVKTGKTYQNYMIDLKPTNDKLKDRAARIVSELANVDYNAACEALILTKYNVKAAILTLKYNFSLEEALHMLKLNDGILRKTIVYIDKEGSYEK